MGFIEYLTDFFRRTGFFIFGFILLPVALVISEIGSTRIAGSLPPVSESNPIASFVATIIFIIGLAMIGYSFKK